MCVTSDLLSTLAQPQALLWMTLVVQGPPWGYHHCLGTTPCTTRLEPWLPVSVHCLYTLVRLTQHMHQDPVPHCSPGRSSAPQSLHYQLRHPRHINEPPRLVGGTAQPGRKLMGKLWVCLCHLECHGTISILPPAALPIHTF